ncbi:MAG: hypothetical protein H6702_04795 [Myxococcales bacterium]|nr:hypothetical protein [Myxococcales bacterium]
MRGLTRLVPVALALAAVGCGPEFDPVSLINDYRLIGLATDTPDTVPDAVLQVSLVDLDPAGTTPGPIHWTVCPYTFGASVAYECLVPETELRLEDAGPTLEVDLATAEFGPYRGLRAALEPAAAELTRQIQAFDPSAAPINADVLLLQGVSVYVKVESGPEGRRQSSVRRVNVSVPQAERCALAQAAATACANGGEGAPFPCPEGVDLAYLATATCETDPNANPGITLFEVAGLNGAAQAAAGSKLTLRVVPAEGARQAFYQRDPDALCPDSDDQEAVRGGPCQEELYFRWYTTQGEFKPGVTFESDTIQDRDTVLTLPKDAEGTLTVFVVAYDGRGGVSYARKDVPIAP